MMNENGSVQSSNSNHVFSIFLNDRTIFSKFFLASLRLYQGTTDLKKNY